MQILASNSAAMLYK